MAGHESPQVSHSQLDHKLLMIELARTLGLEGAGGQILLAAIREIETETIRAARKLPLDRANSRG
jgi:hypothetical protein